MSRTNLYGNFWPIMLHIEIIRSKSKYSDCQALAAKAHNVRAGQIAKTLSPKVKTPLSGGREGDARTDNKKQKPLSAQSPYVEQR